MSSSPRDIFRSLLPLHRLSQKLMEEVGETEDETEVEAVEDGVKLSLGLSLNGWFGVAKRKLSRSSSIPDFLNLSSVMETTTAFSASLSRTCSLPVETEEECRKKREIQSLTRLEAKRKRTEMLSCGSARDRSSSVIEDCSNGIHLKPRTLSQQGSVRSQGSAHWLFWDFIGL